MAKRKTLTVLAGEVRPGDLLIAEVDEVYPVTAVRQYGEEHARRVEITTTAGFFNWDLADSVAIKREG